MYGYAPDGDPRRCGSNGFAVDFENVVYRVQTVIVQSYRATKIKKVMIREQVELD